MPLAGHARIGRSATEGGACLQTDDGARPTGWAGRRTDHAQYLADCPPSIGTTVALTYEASSDSRKATTAAISGASP